MRRRRPTCQACSAPSRCWISSLIDIETGLVRPPLILIDATMLSRVRCNAPIIRVSSVQQHWEAIMATSAQAIDGEKIQAFVGRMLGDLGALTNSVLVHVGDQLGFYKALMKSGPTDSTAIAKQTGTSERL